MHKIQFTILLLLFFSGCANRQPKVNPSKVPQTRASADIVTQLEAKLYDVPVPFHTQGGTLLSDPELAHDTIILSYPTTMSSSELVTLYHQEMERMGWQEITAFKGEETLLIFKKPQRWATISIRDHKTQRDLVLFTGTTNAQSAVA